VAACGLRPDDGTSPPGIFAALLARAAPIRPRGRAAKVAEPSPHAVEVLKESVKEALKA